MSTLRENDLSSLSTEELLNLKKAAERDIAKYKNVQLAKKVQL